MHVFIFYFSSSLEKKEKQLEQAKLKLNPNTTRAKFEHIRNLTIVTLREISRFFNSHFEDNNYMFDLFYELVTPEDGKSFHNEVYDLTFDQSQENSITVQLLKKLKILLEEEDRLENELRTDLDDIEDLHNGVFERGRPYKKYLLGFGIAWELLSLVGMNEFGLTVKIGSAVERGLRPDRFADALQEELELFQYSFSEGPTGDNSDLINRLCLKALHREFEK